MSEHLVFLSIHLASIQVPPLPWASPQCHLQSSSKWCWHQDDSGHITFSKTISLFIVSFFFSGISALSILGMPQFSSEPKFKPELFGTGLRFSSKFGGSAELDDKSGSMFRQSRNFENHCRTQFELNFLWKLRQGLFYFFPFSFSVFCCQWMEIME